MGKSELDAACEAHAVTVSSIHVGLETVEEKGVSRFQDKWKCTIHYKDRSETFDYFTGIGHRVCAYGVKREGLRSKWVNSTGYVAHNESQAIACGFLVIKKAMNPATKRNEVVGPTAADVLSCLLSDMGACTTSFNEWCDSFGTNNDSIKAHITYLACQANGDKVRRVLGHALAEELSTKEH